MRTNRNAKKYAKSLFPCGIISYNGEKKTAGRPAGKDDEYENRNAYERRRLSGTECGARGVPKTLYNEMGKGVTLYGIRDGYRGLIEGATMR